MTDRYFTYRCYDERDRIIYIGFTIDPSRRLHEHAASWWSDVARILTSEHATEQEARRAELTLIRAFDPINNKVGTAGYVPESAGSAPMASGCDWPGCESHEVKDIDGRWLCDPHRRQVRRRQRGDDNGHRGRRNLTEAEKVEIRRRLARFENPGDIAKAFDTTRRTVLRVAKREVA